MKNNLYFCYVRLNLPSVTFSSSFWRLIILLFLKILDFIQILVLAWKKAKHITKRFKANRTSQHKGITQSKRHWPVLWARCMPSRYKENARKRLNKIKRYLDWCNNARFIEIFRNIYCCLNTVPRFLCWDLSDYDWPFMFHIYYSIDWSHSSWHSNSPAPRYYHRISTQNLII